MNLKDTIFKYVQRRHPHNAVYQDYESAKRILLIFESDYLERNPQAKALIKQLQEDGKEVTAWGYINRKIVNSAVLRDYRVLGQKDFDFIGRPKDYERRDLANEHFDLLIDLNTHDLLPLRYLSVYANADFRVGKRTSEPYLNDFMVDVADNDNPVFLFDQLLHYLQSVKSKE